MYDSVIVGGGIAGLQAAIQLGRYDRHVLVVDAGYGRSTICRNYHNLLGWPNGVSGTSLRQLGVEHARKLGVEFLQDRVNRASRNGEGFRLETGRLGKVLHSRTLLLATGLLDRFPPITGLVPCLGRSIYVCPDCDGYEVKNRTTVVLGSGEAGAAMAKLLLYWTNRILYVNHERKPVSASKRKALEKAGVRQIDEKVVRIEQQDGNLVSVVLEDGRQIEAERGFAAFGGNKVQSDLAGQLGVERMENGHILTDPRTKMTNVRNVWAAGDVAVHSEQVTIAMGEGAQAAIWMHKHLLKMEKQKQEVSAGMNERQTGMEQDQRRWDDKARREAAEMRRDEVRQQANANADGEAVQALRGMIEREDENPDEC